MSVQAPTPPSAPAPELPAYIGKYLVRAKLGEGATSEVFLAHDEFHQRDVAVKRVRSGLALDTPEGHFQQHFFAAEAALVGRLQHPNVVQIYDAVEDAEAPTGDGIRRRRHLAALLPRRRAVVAGAGGGDRLQVRDGAGLCLPSGSDPPRRQAGQHPGHATQRPRDERQDHRLPQRHEPAVRAHAGVSCRLAGLHAARATRWRTTTPEPTSTRWPACFTT